MTTERPTRPLRPPGSPRTPGSSPAPAGFPGPGPARAPLTAPTRRALLLAAVASGVWALSAPGTPTARAADDPYDALRHHWLGLALGSGHDPAAEPYASRLRATGDLARTHRATMAPAPGSLWPGHPFDPPAGITRSYARLWTMTQAYAQEGTGLTGDPGLLADLLRGLDHLSATAYDSSTSRYGNWCWAPGTVGPLTVTAPASTFVRRRGRTATLCVSEPPRTGEPFEVVWDGPVRSVARAGPAVEVLPARRGLRVRVTPGDQCGTHRCEVTLT